MGRRVILKAKKLWLLLLLPCVIVLSSNIHTLAIDPPLYEAVKTDLPLTDVVVLFDISGSMRGAKFVKGSEYIAEFVEKLSDKEYLHLRPFAGDAYAPFEMIGNEAAAIIKQRLPRDLAEGTGTDIHLAIMKAIEFLRRPDANRLKALIVITDGYHQPPETNKMISIKDLKEAANQIPSLENLVVYTVELGQYADISLIKEVFSSERVERVTNATPEAIKERLESLKYSIRYKAVKELISEVLAQGLVSVDIDEGEVNRNGEMRIEVNIQNGYPYLPIRVLESKERDSGVFEIFGIDKGFLVYKESPLTVEASHKTELDYPKWTVPRRRTTITLPIDLDIDIQFRDMEALKNLGFAKDAFSPKVALIKPSIELQVQYGIPIWELIFGLISLAVLALGVSLLKVRREDMGFFGYIYIDGRLRSLEGLRGRSINIGGGLSDLRMDNLENPIAELIKEQHGVHEVVKIYPSTGVRLLSSGNEVKDGKLLLGKMNEIKLYAQTGSTITEIRVNTDLMRRNVFYRPVILIIGALLTISSLFFILLNGNTISIL